jgi:enolase-phosphatase E1
MIDISDSGIKAILLDIEGTTTPVDYVFGVLFPFAFANAAQYLRNFGQNPEVQSDLSLLRTEYENEVERDLSLPVWETDPVPYIQYLIQSDRKSTALKSLQGKIWEQGYLAGTLRSQIFADVLPALQRWINIGKQVFIYSSGSVNAQKLLFRYSEMGDMTSYLSGYFDTEIGFKRDVCSYQKITEAIAFPATSILFISDVLAELDAANSSGMKTIFSLRPGNQSLDGRGYPTIHSFDEL